MTTPLALQVQIMRLTSAIQTLSAQNQLLQAALVGLAHGADEAAQEMARMVESAALHPQVLLVATGENAVEVDSNRATLAAKPAEVLRGEADAPPPPRKPALRVVE
ncbi:hypothetical protein J8J14_02210 [Roseomonas sp. SSH11]|uniref:Uncharacterized protein n=1 Tax=Pararoseomonas baculiformis TaxID=2820812 RepID=A0ABS4A9A0_9PROT|nr:hypothetical protein [Pararoseomonas baculiformis]MBP0443580.1 hypothetical protein [Pararoseomonas baculiformis]